jgi:hypothetical protein
MSGPITPQSSWRDHDTGGVGDHQPKDMSEDNAGFFATDRRRMPSTSPPRRNANRYEADAGTPELVLVHGWSCNRRYWDT